MRFSTAICSVWRGSLKHLVVAMAIVSAGLVFSMMLLVAFNVLGRYFFNHPVTGTIELTMLLMVGIIFLGYAYAQRRRMHIRVTLFTSRLGAKGQLISDILYFSVTAVFFSILAWRTTIAAIDSWQIREILQGVLPLPVYPAKTLIPIASVMAVLQSVADLVGVLRGHSKGD